MMQRGFSNFAQSILFALACAICAGTLLAPSQAQAVTSSVQTASVTASYANPLTGVIEDSAGDSNTALGESMVAGVSYENALVEVDTQGQTYVTLRFKLAQQVSDMQFWYAPAAGGDFVEAPAQLMQADQGADTADYRIAVSSAQDVIRVSMFVSPMGRSVVFFQALSVVSDGNVDTFVQSIVPGEELEEAVTTETVQETAAEEAQPSAEAEEAAAETAEVQETASTQDSDISEYNADGQEVTGAQDASSATVPVAAIVVIVVVAAIAGAAVYVLRVKPQRARAAQAAAAAQPKRSDQAGE